MKKGGTDDPRERVIHSWLHSSHGPEDPRPHLALFKSSNATFMLLWQKI